MVTSHLSNVDYDSSYLNIFISTTDLLTDVTINFSSDFSGWYTKEISLHVKENKLKSNCQKLLTLFGNPAAHFYTVATMLVGNLYCNILMGWCHTSYEYVLNHCYSLHNTILTHLLISWM